MTLFRKQAENGDKETKEEFCDLCIEGNHAVGICLECSVYICSLHQQAHKFTKSTFDHQIADLKATNINVKQESQKRDGVEPITSVQPDNKKAMAQVLKIKHSKLLDLKNSLNSYQTTVDSLHQNILDNLDTEFAMIKLHYQQQKEFLGIVYKNTLDAVQEKQALVHKSIETNERVLEQEDHISFELYNEFQKSYEALLLSNQLKLSKIQYQDIKQVKSKEFCFTEYEKTIDSPNLKLKIQPNSPSLTLEFDFEKGILDPFLVEKVPTIKFGDFSFCLHCGIDHSIKFIFREDTVEYDYFTLKIHGSMWSDCHHGIAWVYDEDIRARDIICGNDSGLESLSCTVFKKLFRIRIPFKLKLI